MYGFRFFDAAGRLLSEVGLPVAWNHAEFKRVMPVTFFGVTIECPGAAAMLEVWNRGTGTRLGGIDLDRSVPEVYLEAPEAKAPSAVRLRWRAQDREGTALTYMVLISNDGESWWPAAHGLSTPEHEVDTRSLESGEYQVEVLALNSIRAGRSNRVTFRVGELTAP
jgi:hypothetical protein